MDNNQEKPQETSTVLIIEDDNFIGSILQKKLMNNGFRSLLTPTGAEGLSTLEKEAVDIVLLDILLPEMDGFEVLQKIKGNPKTQGVPVIMLSNLDQPEDVQKSMKLGAEDYLVKANFTTDKIIHKIHGVLAKK
ncbi:MAG: response regulator [Candidatus Pacebacteria bacterium]|nr:response regulator [Candidatus Paceibacterota bacterium]